MTTKRLFSVLPSGVLLASLIGFSAATLAADVAVLDPVTRAVPEVSPNSAAFLTLKNSGSQAVTLTSVVSDIASRVELHGHKMEGDVMRMYKHDHGIELPSGASVALKSGGDHIMLMGLKKTLHVGDVVNLTLSFSDGDTLDVEAPVVDMSTQHKTMGHAHHH